MPEHERTNQEKASFHPVDGMRGYCKCGRYIDYIPYEGEVECGGCGRVWNVYVDFDLWEESE